jgi:cobalt-zinc-cadmium efflux system protein
MTQARRLLIVLALNILMIAGLIMVGLSSHSLGVLAAGGDYLLDSSAIIFGLFAIYIRDRKGEQSHATSIVALLNVFLLLIITITVTVEAIHRLSTHTSTIHAFPVVLISSIAAIVMGIGVYILQGDPDEDDLHMRSVLLDTLADAVSAAAIAITGVIILVTKRFFWADSVLAMLISIAIGYQALVLLRDVTQGFKQ